MGAEGGVVLRPVLENERPNKLCVVLGTTFQCKGFVCIISVWRFQCLYLRQEFFRLLLIPVSEGLQKQKQIYHIYHRDKQVCQ